VVVFVPVVVVVAFAVVVVVVVVEVEFTNVVVIGCLKVVVFVPVDDHSGSRQYFEPETK